MLWIIAAIGIDLPNKGALALMAGFTEFIPYVGPFIGGIPALIVATSLYGIPGMLTIGIAYYIIQWTENNVLIPYMMKRSL
jgi:predicted PurR-regulated permease PerM